MLTHSLIVVNIRLDQNFGQRLLYDAINPEDENFTPTLIYLKIGLRDLAIMSQLYQIRWLVLVTQVTPFLLCISM
jgi:hypothetical protein